MTSVTDTDDLEIRVIDALALDLDEQAGLAQHLTVKYKRPLAVFPEDCPLLCVYMLSKHYTPKTTEMVDNALAIGISWQEQAIESAKDLVRDPEQSQSLLRAMGKVQQRIRHLHINGWTIPEAYAVIPNTVNYLPPITLETGAVEGYAMTVEVRVTERG